MQYKDKAILYVEERVSDGYGGYEIIERELTSIDVCVAPYRVEVGEVVNVPNPLASVKFFTNAKLDFDEDTFFYIRHNNKKYKKVSFTDYDKCILILAERV